MDGREAWKSIYDVVPLSLSYKAIEEKVYVCARTFLRRRLRHAVGWSRVDDDL